MEWNEFTSLVFPYKNKLYRLALRLLENRADAEDVVQEVYIKLWNRKEELYAIQNIEAWCVRITKNLSLDKLKSKHKRTLPIAENFDLIGRSNSPYKVTEVNDQVNQVHQLIGKLPPKQKMAIQLRDIEGLTYQEISIAMGTSMSNVKILIFRARNFIKKHLLKAESYGLQKD